GMRPVLVLDRSREGGTIKNSLTNDRGAATAQTLLTCRFPGFGMKNHPTRCGGGVIGPASPVAWGAHRWARPETLALGHNGWRGSFAFALPNVWRFPLAHWCHDGRRWRRRRRPQIGRECLSGLYNSQS